MPDDEALTRINAVKLTTSDMLVFVMAGATLCHLPGDSADGSEVAAVEATSPFASRDQGQKAFALLSRLQALAELLYEGLPGWASPGNAAPGSSMASRAIFAAAAEQPLVRQGQAYVFDRTAFLERVALIAEREQSLRRPLAFARDTR